MNILLMNILLMNILQAMSNIQSFMPI